MFARLRCGGNLPLCLAFGTGVLWWLGGWVVGIRYRRGPPTVRNMRAVLKQAPVVRDAFSEALGAQNSLLRYGRDIRYRKRPPTVRDASSKARRTADSTDCGQPTAHRTHFQCAKRPRSDVSRHKKRVTSKSIKT